MDVARFNFSHGDYDAQSKRLEQLIRVREAQGVPVATLLDTKGPEIRTGDFEDPNGVVIHKKVILLRLPQKNAWAMPSTAM